MSNSWFDFKQFRIEQGACAMKVSTDACIQGAWAPVPADARKALDIGIGTGLLSLMLVQRFPHLQIDAVELDADAAAQAIDNVAASPWPQRVEVRQADAKALPQGNYDFIICNPPFFHQSLKSPDAARNRARHTDSLTQEDLLALMETQLAPDGTACIMLPVPEHSSWKSLVEHAGWLQQRTLLIQDNPGKIPGRVVSCWSRKSNDEPDVERLLIRDGSGDYTTAFRALLAPFYLHF